MIKLETAVKLKEAGLEWEPQIYDFYESDNGIENVSSLSFNDGKVSRVDKWNWRPGKYYLSRLIWLPRLDQLLAEIERLGWEYELRNDEAGIDYVCFVFSEGYNEYAHANTPTNAAASALLWIYEGRAKA